MGTIVLKAMIVKAMQMIYQCWKCHLKWESIKMRKKTWGEIKANLLNSTIFSHIRI